jgi:dCMP deaminase
MSFIKLTSHNHALKTDNSKKFLEIAKIIASFSRAKRLQVGAVIVSTRGRILGTGFNGTPNSVDNVCETVNNKTYDYVIHAELNSILNASSSDLRGSTMYLTDSPCIKCASAILQVGISKIIFLNKYRITDGIDFLIKHGVEVYQYSIED